MLSRLDWLISAPLIEAASAIWLSGHALPVLAIAAFLLIVAVSAPRITRRALPRILPTRTALVVARAVRAEPCQATAPPLRGARAARAPGRAPRALLPSP